MPYNTSMPIAARASSGWRALALWATERGAIRSEEVWAYLKRIHELCGLHGLDWRILAAQSIHETTDPETGAPWASFWWMVRLNPAGIGITGDPVQNAASRVFASGREAAEAHVVHMLGYVNGSDLSGYLSPDMDPRWDALMDSGWQGTVRRIADLNNKWAADGRYAEKIVSRMNALEPLLEANAEEAETPPEDNGMAASKRWYVITVRGHGSTGDGGSDIERQLTDDLARAYTEEGRKRGYATDYWQRDLDGDSLLEMTKGGLDTVALGVAKAIGKSTAPIVLMLDLHLNGRTSPVHSIVAQATGLRSPYAGGAPADDIPANNTLDVAIAKEISKELSGQLGLPNFTVKQSAIGVAGVMAESQTGVAQNFDARLAMMGATAPHRHRAVRLVIEHAGSDQLVKVTNWAAKAASAAFDAIDRIYAQRNSTGEDPGPTPEPVPNPEEYPDPIVIPELAAYVQAGQIVKEPPIVTVAANGDEYTYAPASYLAAVDTRRLISGKPDAVDVGAVLKAGTSFPGFFILRNEAGHFLVTGWWTHFTLADVKRVPA